MTNQPPTDPPSNPLLIMGEIMRGEYQRRAWAPYAAPEPVIIPVTPALPHKPIPECCGTHIPHPAHETCHGMPVGKYLLLSAIAEMLAENNLLPGL